MSIARVVRSVALYASGRVGNVIPEASEPRDVCRGCGTNTRDAGVAGVTMSLTLLEDPVLVPVADNCRSWTHSVNPQSYNANSLILCAYPIERSSGFLFAITSRHAIASGHAALILGRITFGFTGSGTGGTGNGASLDSECLGLTWGLGLGLFARAEVTEGVRGSAEKRFRFVSAPLSGLFPEPDAFSTSSSEP